MTVFLYFCFGTSARPIAHPGEARGWGARAAVGAGAVVHHHIEHWACCIVFWHFWHCVCHCRPHGAMRNLLSTRVVKQRKSRWFGIVWSGVVNVITGHVNNFGNSEDSPITTHYLTLDVWNRFLHATSFANLCSASKHASSRHPSYANLSWLPALNRGLCITTARPRHDSVHWFLAQRNYSVLKTILGLCVWPVFHVDRFNNNCTYMGSNIYRHCQYMVGRMWYHVITGLVVLVNGGIAPWVHASKAMVPLCKQGPGATLQNKA